MSLESPKQEIHFDASALAQTMETEVFRNEGTLQIFESLVNELRDKLSTYDTILSDDASGRLVSLVLRKIINKCRNKDGKTPVHTYFLASGKHYTDTIMPKIKTFLGDKKTDIKNALLVTEYIESGQSIEKLTKIIDELKIPFDIATLSIADSPNNYDTQISSRLYYGEQSIKGIQFWGKRLLTGVQKDQNIDSPHPVKTSAFNPEQISAARRDVKRLADALMPITGKNE